MACGSPVVSTDCPSGPREILGVSTQGTGPIGTLVPVDDPTALSEAILKELSLERDPVTLTRRAGRFASERAIRSYLDLMQVARTVGEDDCEQPIAHHAAR